jgi:hypothetical protein
MWLWVVLGWILVAGSGCRLQPSLQAGRPVLSFGVYRTVGALNCAFDVDPSLQTSKFPSSHPIGVDVLQLIIEETRIRVSCVRRDLRVDRCQS